MESNSVLQRHAVVVDVDDDDGDASDGAKKLKVGQNDQLDFALLLLLRQLDWLCAVWLQTHQVHQA